MASLDSLAPDHRAVLELVLRQRQSYDTIAQRLSIDRDTVRDRALAAMDALAPPTELDRDDRSLIADYLLGELDDADRERVSRGFDSSSRLQAYALGLEAQIVSLGASPRSGSATPVPPPRDRRPRSRRGGAILLGAGSLLALAGIVVAVVLVTRGSSSRSATARTEAARASSIASASSATSVASDPASATSSSGARVVAQIELTAPATYSKAQGVAEVLQQGSSMGIAIAAQNLSPNGTHPPSAYAIWLYNTAADSRRLGFVNPGVGTSGRFEVANLLPGDAARYRQVIVTLETTASPRAPGRIVLRGPMTL